MAQLQASAVLDAPASRPFTEAHPSATARAAPRHGVMTVAFRTRAELYLAWMPFVRGGGFFVQSTRRHELEEEVFVLLTLANEAAKPVRGKVVWINPPNASGGRPQGIGVSIEGDPAAEEICKTVQVLLANALGSARPTHTL